MVKLLYVISFMFLAMGCESGTGANLSIWEAAEQGDIAVVQNHIDGGTDVNAKGARTWMEATPLHHAVKGGQLGMVKHLLDKGADVNALGRETPLGSGVTALDISVKSKENRVEISEYLRDHGAKLSSELVDE
jgi:ankyrin repeat protein